MASHISKQEVKDNILRFQASLSEHKLSPEQRNRSYNALVNCETGDLLFSDEKKAFQEFQALEEKWKEVQIGVETAPKNVAKFKVSSLDSKEMSPLAKQIVRETISLLNTLATEHPAFAPQTLPEEAACAGIREIELAPIQPIEALRGWVGELNRIEAELLLDKKPVGSYLLRHGDEYTNVMVEQISETNHRVFRGFVCTVKDTHSKISDVLFILTDKGWMIYEDNPKISDYTYYSSPQELITLFRHRARVPV